MSSYESDWTLDFCLSCDTQITSGLYCSQACHMLDKQKGNPSHFNSAYGKKSKSSSSRNTSNAARNERTPGVQLPPSVDFSTYKPTKHASDELKSSKRSSMASVSSYSTSSSSSTGSPNTPTGSPAQRYSQRSQQNRHSAALYSGSRPSGGGARHSIYGSTWS